MDRSQALRAALIEHDLPLRIFAAFDACEDKYFADPETVDVVSSALLSALPPVPAPTVARHIKRKCASLGVSPATRRSKIYEAEIRALVKTAALKCVPLRTSTSVLLK